MITKIKDCDTENPFVFVSYSKEDKDIVYPLIVKLQEAGCNIWIDKQLQKMIGKDWQQAVLKEVIANEKCRAILFMVSENSLTSAPVYSELMWSQHSIKVKRTHKKDHLRILPINVDATWVPSKSIDEWIDETVSENHQKLERSDYDVMDIGCIDKRRYSEEEITHLEEKGEIAYAVYEDIFVGLGGNKITFASHNDVDTILENIPKETIINPKSKSTRKLIVKEHEITKASAEKVRKKSFSVTGDITYTLYGKTYTENQSDMMFRFFEETLKRHTDIIPAVIDMRGMNCLSAIDYSKKENRTGDMPSYFRNSRYFTFPTGSVCVGTAYAVSDKCKKMALLLDICGESRDVFSSEQVSLP